jgi:ABC-type antimicrobial peptide transport system permease subunit
MPDFVDGNLNVWSVHILEYLFSVFGIVAVVLAVVGVYGVKAHAAARRTREIGIRMAVGARAGDVLRLLLHQSVLQAACGVALGLALAGLVGQFLAHAIYRTPAWDPAALLAGSIPVALVAIGASLIPAWRATRIDPTQALRTE